MSAEKDIPANYPIEEHLLGALFLHPGVLAEAQRWCAKDDFWIGKHRRVWDACVAMQEKHGRVSRVLLEQYLAEGGLEGDDLSDLLYDVSNWVAYCEDHTLVRPWAQEIEALAVRRRLIAAGGRIATAGYERSDTDDAVREAYQILGNAAERRVNAGELTLEATTDALYERLTAGETGRGIPSGLPRLDRAQQGLRPGELTVLAARTAHGKTALALQVARHVAGTGTPVAYLSLEMDADALTERLVSQEAGIPVRAVLEGGGDDGALQQTIDAIGALHNLPVTFSVAPATTLPEVKRVVARWADVGLCQLLVVDYLQLVSLGRGGGGNRAYEVGAVAQALHDLAQEHKIHVLALAQLNRAIEHRSDPRPVLADLRESGGIEQAADAVWLMWRPDMLASDRPQDQDAAFVHLAKNRSGPPATEPLTFEARSTRFRLLDEHH